MSGQEMLRVRVTPDLAKEWLARAHVQRTLRKNRVQRYAEDMREGRWGEDIAPLVFDTEDNLANGQHRLNAVVESGVAQEFWVLTGVSPDAIGQMDTGAPRSISDQLRFAGVANYAAVGSSARAVLRYHLYPDAVWASSNDVSNSQIVAEVQRAEALYAEAAQEGDAVRRAVRRSPVAAYGALCVVVHEQSPNADMWDEWHRGVVTGARLAEDDARLALRAFYMREDVRHWGNTQSRLLASIWAWNKWVRDEPLRLLRNPRRDELPMKKVS